MKTKQNFTLVELLIVIAVIAILASMILPALRTSLDKARAIQCTSNQKQLGTATFLYTDDNKGYMPTSSQEYFTLTPSWATFIWSYTTGEAIVSDFAYLRQLPSGSYEPKLNIFTCPAVMDPFKPSEEMKHIGRNKFFSVTDAYKPNLFITKCHWPTLRMLYADYHATTAYQPTLDLDSITYLHPGATTTVTYLDGHVKALNIHSVPTEAWNSRFWGGNPSCDGTLP